MPLLRAVRNLGPEPLNPTPTPQPRDPPYSSDWDFLCEVLSAVIDAGARTVNIADTVGYTVPSEYSKMMEYLIANTDRADDAIWSVHCHNDLGLAVANTLAAVECGARQVEVTMNGIGERAGNTSLEELVMALRTRLPFERREGGAVEGGGRGLRKDHEHVHRVLRLHGFDHSACDFGVRGHAGENSSDARKQKCAGNLHGEAVVAGAWGMYVWVRGSGREGNAVVKK